MYSTLMMSRSMHAEGCWHGAGMRRAGRRRTELGTASSTSSSSSTASSACSQSQLGREVSKGATPGPAQGSERRKRRRQWWRQATAATRQARTSAAAATTEMRLWKYMARAGARKAAWGRTPRAACSKANAWARGERCWPAGHACERPIAPYKRGQRSRASAEPHLRPRRSASNQQCAAHGCCSLGCCGE